MPDERLTKYDLTELRAKYHEIERQTTAGVLNRYFLPSIDNWLQMLLDCHAFSIDRRARDEHSSLMEAYASVSSVAYSNAESGRVALLRGFYGNVFSLIRPLAMANDLVIDLTNTAQSPENWIALREFQPKKGGNNAKRLRAFFKDGAVRQRVKDLGEYSPSADLYSLLSDPVHVTPWSTHMYSYELLEQPGGYSVQYAPQYNPFRALICAHLINMTLPHLSGYFVAFCEQHYAGDARFDDLASRQDRMIRNYDTQSLKTRVLLDWIARAQQRLRDGDAFDEVFSAPPSASCH